MNERSLKHDIGPIHIIGGGMAGSEAAWAAANLGVPVIVGLLHDEMRRTGSIMMEMAARHAVPAGSALAVDRDAFSAAVTERLLAHPLITLERGEIAGLPPAEWDSVVVVIATGPLTSPALAQAIRERTGETSLAFFDAIAPIVYADSIDMEKAWFQSRYDKGETEEERTAYLNCPMDRAQYETFIDALIAAPNHGRARPRNPALRPTEAGWADQPAPARCQSTCNCSASTR
jgi:methylenetetrahydrofolate--tRNA-(uracil-5-)-methyltransferase